MYSSILETKIYKSIWLKNVRDNVSIKNNHLNQDTFLDVFTGEPRDGNKIDQ